MRYARILGAALTVGLLTIPRPALEAQAPAEYELTPIVFPPEYGGYVYVKDINNRGDVLGWAFPGRNLGLVLNEDGLRTVAIEGTWYMQPVAITSNGRVAGIYFDTASTWHSFVIDQQGTIRPVVVPGDWDITSPQDISDNGNLVVGYAVVPGFGRSVGYFQDRKSTRFFEYPGARHTNLYAVNNAGATVGFWSGDTGSGAFLLRRDGSVVNLRPPGSEPILLQAINNFGVAAGTCADGVRPIGCVLRNGVRIPIEYPAPPAIEYSDPETGITHDAYLSDTYTEITGINDHGVIVGHTEGIYYALDLPYEVVRVYPFTGTPAR